MKKEINAAFVGGGLCSVIGLGAYSIMKEKYDFTSFSGASIGSVIAISLAAGKSPEEIRDFLAENVEPFCVPILGRKRIQNRVNIFLGNMLYRNLPKECIVSITPLRKNFPILITRENSENLTVGEVAALSSALPGLFLPGFVKLEGKYAFVVDGGILFNPPLKDGVENFLFSYKRNDNPPKYFWGKRKLAQEKRADYLLKQMTNYGTRGKRDDVFSVFKEGILAAKM